MIAVRHGLMATLRTMNVVRFVIAVAKCRRATVRILRVYLEDMLFDDVTLLMVEVTVVEIVDMVAMFDGDVTAGGAMFVGVVGVNGVRVICHVGVLSSLMDQWISEACAIALSTRLST
jgi:hypothetical protein